MPDVLQPRCLAAPCCQRHQRVFAGSLLPVGGSDHSEAAAAATSLADSTGGEGGKPQANAGPRRRPQAFPPPWDFGTQRMGGL